MKSKKSTTEFLKSPQFHLLVSVLGRNDLGKISNSNFSDKYSVCYLICSYRAPVQYLLWIGFLACVDLCGERESMAHVGCNC